MPDDPTVRLGCPYVDGVEMADALIVECSACGEVTDWMGQDPGSKQRAIRAAAEHAQDIHDNLVDAVGWVR